MKNIKIVIKTGDQASYKMELLEQDKSSELQERFLQVKFEIYLQKISNLQIFTKIDNFKGKKKLILHYIFSVQPSFGELFYSYG